MFNSKLKKRIEDLEWLINNPFKFNIDERIGEMKIIERRISQYNRGHFGYSLWERVKEYELYHWLSGTFLTMNEGQIEVYIKNLVPQKTKKK